MIKLMPKRFSRSSSSSSKVATAANSTAAGAAKIKWELRPGGMLVQKRECNQEFDEDVMIRIRVSTVSHCHDISIQATSTFGELKLLMAILTKMEVKAQRILYKGKEREDEEHLHMVGVRDNEKVVLLEDPAMKERKLLGVARPRPYRTISV